MFDGTEDWCKIWRKTGLCFLEWHEEFGKFLFTGWKIVISFYKGHYIKIEAQAKKMVFLYIKKVKNIPTMTQFRICQVTVSHGFEYVCGSKYAKAW